MLFSGWDGGVMGMERDVWGCENGWRGMEREKIKLGRKRMRRRSCMSC